MKNTSFIRKIAATFAGLALLATPIALSTSNEAAVNFVKQSVSPLFYSEGPWAI